MQVQISRFALTNIRELGASRADLAQALHSLQEGSLVFASDFPSKNDDLCVVTDRILSHVAAADTTSMISSPDLSTLTSSSNTNLTRYALWSEPRDVWCLKIDPLWIDFIGARSVGQSKSVPFVDAVPITLWVHGKSLGPPAELPPSSESTIFTAATAPKDDFVLSVHNLPQTLGDRKLFDDNMRTLRSNNPFMYNSGDDLPSVASDSRTVIDSDDAAAARKDDAETAADLHVIAHVSNLVSVQIDHFQYLFLLRLSEEITELATFLSLDSNRILQKVSRLYLELLIR